MQEFIHHKINVIEELITKFNRVQQLYNDKSFDYETQLHDFLNELLEYFNSRGDNMNESEILNSIGTLKTIKRGFNPMKMQKIDTGRRDLFWGFAFTVQESVLEIIRKMYDKEKQKLEDGEELITNLILSLHQNKILTDDKIKELNSVQKIEVFWAFLLTQNDTISSFNKKLRMSLTPEDIYLLFEKSLLKIS